MKRIFVAIDRPSKRAFAELQPQATQAIAGAFVERVLARISCRVHQGLTDKGIQFRNMPITPTWAGTLLGGTAPSGALSSASPSRPTPGPTARSNA